MFNSNSAIRHEFGPITKHHLRVIQQRITRDVSRKLHPQQPRPLLDALGQIRIGDDPIRGAVPELHARVRARPGGVHGAGGGHPLGLRLDVRAVAAVRVRTHQTAAGRAGQAAGRHARIARCGGEEVRVRGGEDGGHHRAGRGAGHEDARGVGVVGLECVAHHVGEARGVAAAVVDERLGGRYIPTVVVVLGLGEDGDEAVDVGVSCPVGYVGVSSACVDAAVDLEKFRDWISRTGGEGNVRLG